MRGCSKGLSSHPPSLGRACSAPRFATVGEGLPSKPPREVWVWAMPRGTPSDLSRVAMSEASSDLKLPGPDLSGHLPSNRRRVKIAHPPAGALVRPHCPLMCFDRLSMSGLLPNHFNGRDTFLPLPLALDALGASAGHVQQQAHASSNHAHAPPGPAPALAPLAPGVALLHIKVDGTAGRTSGANAIVCSPLIFWSTMSDNSVARSIGPCLSRIFR